MWFILLRAWVMPEPITCLCWLVIPTGVNRMFIFIIVSGMHVEQILAMMNVRFFSLIQ